MKAFKVLMAICVVSASFGAGWRAGGLFAPRTGGLAPQTGYTAAERDVPSRAVSGFGEREFMISSAQGGGDSVSIVKGAANSVVSINVKSETTPYFGGWRAPSRQLESAGSGVIFSRDDGSVYIVTNNHVINGASEVSVSVDDKNSAAANFVGSDSANDIAVISVSLENLKKAGITDYSIASFGDSDKLEVGERVIAIGNSYGEGKSATEGIISALGKDFETESGAMLSAIQTDAAINPGNSGGALVNSACQVVGINTAKLAAFAVEGMGYSIPSKKVKSIVDDIMNQRGKATPYLGVLLAEVDARTKELYGLPSTGLYVSEVVPGSGAAEGGVRSGDLITEFNGSRVETQDQLTEAISKTAVGETAALTLYRNGADRTTTVSIVLGKREPANKF
ncbi:MAG: trypsin-like peptidase domain-containing protein [Clostridiales bacterium]|jgi:serine protease Do|nr:trypsin-like peptidase domain-containing protein [Clostridiales bacterium]